MEDTIAAISTPVGAGGIAIVRLSGPRALAVADAIFCTARGKPSEFPTHTVHHGTIGHDGELLDEVLLTVMRAPRSYTTEDVVEINCHGGHLTARSILAHCLTQGARLAEPGEFTRRAFLNGRIDLTQAEAVMDLIQAKTERAQHAAANALEGHLARRIEELRDRLIGVLAHAEAHIDFPDEDIMPDTREKLLSELEAVSERIKQLLGTAYEGRVLREGISVAIIGRPNVGKSSLMNALLGQDRCIVTPVPGTTRDSLEEMANIRGIPIRLIDTAGIRKARGHVEAVGVGRSHKVLESSDLILHVMDSSRPFSRADIELAVLYAKKRTIQVLNKCDLAHKWLEHNELRKQKRVVVSALQGDGIEELKDRIEQVTQSGCESQNRFDIAINERHVQSLQKAVASLAATSTFLRQGAETEIVVQELRFGLGAIGEIVGRTTPEDVLDKIFSTFCIGK